MAFAKVKAGTKLQSIPGPGEDPQTYETVEDFEARKEWNVLPALTPLSAQIRPCISPTTSREMASPRPLPPNLRVVEVSTWE